MHLCSFIIQLDLIVFQEALEPLTVEDLLNVGIPKEAKKMDRSKAALLKDKEKAGVYLVCDFHAGI